METLLKRRVRTRLENLGKNPFEVAREGGLERGFINDILIDKKESVRGPGLARLAKALMVPVEYLMIEDYELSSDIDHVRSDDAESDIDKVYVKQLDLRFSMGGGADYNSDVQAVPMSFSRAWIRQITNAPFESLFWATGFGDSMYPTIADGDIVLVDTSQKQPTMNDKVWALHQYGLGMIKRLRATSNGYTILSDNPSVPPDQAVDGSMEVVGRVVAVVRRI